MPAMSVGGLASGLDTNSIISQLTALEQTKVTREAKKKEAAQSTLDKFKELQTRLSTLQSKANGLNAPTNFNVYAATSNYPDYVQVRGGEGATAGQYEITVNQLATTQKVASNGFAAINTAIGGEGTITLSTSVAAQKKDSTKKTVEVKIEASDTLKDIANKINAAEGAGVKASLMIDEDGRNRLVLTAVDTGTNGFFISEPSGGNILTDVLGILDDSEQKAKSANALVTIKGEAATSTTKFDELNTNLGKNNLVGGDVIGIYLPNDKGDGSSGWVTFDLYKRNLNLGLNPGDPGYLDPDDPDSGYGELTLGSDGKPIAKTIGDVLGEINAALNASGANFTASLNSSGEIVVQGQLDADGNFKSANLGNVKIQIMSYKSGYDEAAINGVATTVTKDTLLGTDKVTIENAADDAALNAVKAAAAAAGEDVEDPGFDLNAAKNTYSEEYGRVFDDEVNKAILRKKGYNEDTISTMLPGNRKEAVDREIQKEIERQQQAMFTVKKDMGKFSKANVFNEPNVIHEAKNAFYTRDGVGISSQSNEDDKTVNGTTFVLLRETEPSKVVKVGLELDQNALVDKIAGFIEEFNALLRFIDENAKAITKEEENPVTGKKENTRITGPFTGDSAVNSIRDQLKAMMTSTINQITTALNKDGNTGYKGTEYSSASRIGIVTNREGYLDVDRDKLNKALTADFEGVRKLFSANSFSDTNGFKVGNFTKNSKAGVYEVNATTGEVTLNGEKVEATVYGNIITTKDGLSFEVPSSGTAKVTFVRGVANQVSNFIEIAKSLTITLSNGKVVPGFFKQTEKTYEERIKGIQERMDVLQRRVDSYSMRITNQFNSLERSMSTLQSQTSNMMSALSGMNYNTRR